MFENEEGMIPVDQCTCMTTGLGSSIEFIELVLVNITSNFLRRCGAGSLAPNALTSSHDVS